MAVIQQSCLVIDYGSFRGEPFTLPIKSRQGVGKGGGRWHTRAEVWRMCWLRSYIHHVMVQRTSIFHGFRGISPHGFLVPVLRISDSFSFRPQRWVPATVELSLGRNLGWVLRVNFTHGFANKVIVFAVLAFCISIFVFLLTEGGEPCSPHSSVVDKMWVKKDFVRHRGSSEEVGVGGPDRHHGVHDHLWSRSVGTAQDGLQQGLIQMLGDRIASTVPRTVDMNDLLVCNSSNYASSQGHISNTRKWLQTKELLCRVDYK